MTDQEFFNLVKRVLSIGFIIKNYKELCKLLNQEPTTGNAKKAQHKEWQRYFNYEKSGQKYIITEIYDNPLQKNDKRSLGNSSIYVQHIELILLNYLSKQQGYTATLTLKRWFLLMGMINPKYIEYEEDRKILKKLNTNITDYQINHFYQRTYQKHSRNIGAGEFYLRKIYTKPQKGIGVTRKGRFIPMKPEEAAKYR